VTFGTNPSWGRLIDFGQTDENGNGEYCVDFTPHSGNSPAGVNFEISATDPGFSGAQEDASPPILDNSGYMHLVLVDNPFANTLTVYTNGVQMVQITGVAVPMSALQDAHSYLGKSSYSSDPNGVASVDEFRIYNGAMSPSQVLADFAAGADTVPSTPPILSVACSGNDLVLSWPTNATGYAVQTAASLAGAAWNSLPSNPVAVLSNGTFKITVPITNQTSYYRLTN
jgi:hypothetical protein